MSDIDNTIDTLKEQVEALQADNEQLREANAEWSELASEYDLDTLQNFVSNHDLDDVDNLLNEYDISEIHEGMEFVKSHDIDELESALRWCDVDDLVRAYNRAEEYGDPEELAEKVEELEEQLTQISEEKDAAETFGENDVPDSGPVTVKLQDELANELTVVTAERDKLKGQLAEFKAVYNDLRALGRILDGTETA